MNEVNHRFYTIRTRRKGLFVQATLHPSTGGIEESTWVFTHGEGLRWARRVLAEKYPDVSIDEIRP